MKPCLFIAAILSASTASMSCAAAPTDVNESNFLTAIKKRASGERACFQTHVRVGKDKSDNTVYFFEQDGKRTTAQLEAEFAALKELGLITDGIGYLPFPKNMVWTKDLKFTEVGRNAMKTERAANSATMAALCFATPRPTKVVKWEGPAQFMGSTLAKVTFIYQLDAVAPWANSEKVQSFYPDLREQLKKKDGVTGELALKLTNVGWE